MAAPAEQAAASARRGTGERHRRAWRRRVGRPPPAVAGGAAADRRARHRPRHDRGHRRRRSHHAPRMSRPSSSRTGAAPARAATAPRRLPRPSCSVASRAARHASCRSRTSGGAPPSTWSGRSRRRRTRYAVDGGRLRQRRAGPRRAEADVAGPTRAVALTYLPFVVACRRRRAARVPASSTRRVGDDELIVHHDVHLGIRGRPRVRGPDGAGRPRRRRASGCVRWPVRSRDLAARAAVEAARPGRDRRRARSRSPTSGSYGTLHDVADHQPAADRDPLDRRRQASARW